MKKQRTRVFSSEDYRAYVEQRRDEHGVTYAIYGSEATMLWLAQATDSSPESIYHRAEVEQGRNGQWAWHVRTPLELQAISRGIKKVTEALEADIQRFKQYESDGVTYRELIPDDDPRAKALASNNVYSAAEDLTFCYTELGTLWSIIFQIEMLELL